MEKGLRANMNYVIYGWPKDDRWEIYKAREFVRGRYYTDWEPGYVYIVTEDCYFVVLAARNALRAFENGSHLIWSHYFKQKKVTWRKDFGQL